MESFKQPEIRTFSIFGGAKWMMCDRHGFTRHTVLRHKIRRKPKPGESIYYEEYRCTKCSRMR